MPALPVRVRITGAPKRPGPFELVITIENATRAKAVGFFADAVEGDIVKALERLRAAAATNRPIREQAVRLRGDSRPIRVDVWAQLSLRGTIGFPAGTVRELTSSRFSRLLGGETLRITVSGEATRAAVPRLTLVAEPVIRGAIPRRSARTLQAAVLGYLRYARTRQFQAFLANPDPRGPSVTTYVYETAAAAPVTGRSESEPDDSGIPAALVLGGLALLGAGLVVLWAHL